MEMESGAVEKKQATILGLSEELDELLGDLQSRLDNRFNRCPQPEKAQDKPQAPNVLDEIIERLHSNRVSLARIMSFISSDVLPKIN